jgi:hypothetical protein
MVATVTPGPSRSARARSSLAITREFYISKPAIAADVAHVLEELAHPENDRVAVLSRILAE